ncbi:MAG: WD domain, G-beta repeat [Syntrophorhabdus sp. PtaB.Bin006]|nr:MAG: WD domain, G-beta repeat [Syntrophorhabdus sp. PtaB.Bin006]
MREGREKSLNSMPTRIASRSVPLNLTSPSAQAIASILEGYAPFHRLTHDLGFHKERITTLATAFDEKCLVTGSYDGTVRLWDVASGECIRVFYCHDRTIWKILVTPKKNLMITTGFELKKLWDLGNGDCLADLSREPGEPFCCNDTHLFCKQNWDVRHLLNRSPDSKRSETLAYSEILVYEVDTGKRIRRFETNSYIHSLAVAPDGQTIAALSIDNCLRIWDVKSGTCLHISSWGDDSYKIMGITPDSRLIVLESTKSIQVLDITKFRTVLTIKPPSGSTWNEVVLRGFHLIDKRVAFERPWYFRVIDIRTGMMLRTDFFKGQINLGSITEKEEFCLSRLGWDKHVVWDIRNHEVVASLPLDPAYAGEHLGTATFSGRRQMAVSRRESIARIIDLPSGQCIKVISANEPVRDILITPDGKSLVTLGRSAAIQWDLTSGRHVREFSVPNTEFRNDLPDNVSLMAVTPDGRLLVLPSGDGVALWDLATGGRVGGFSLGRLSQAAENGSPGPFALHVTADGKRLMVVSGSTGFLGSYDLQSGTAVQGFPIPGIGRFHAFRIGGSLFATSEGSILSLWDGESGVLLHRCNQGDDIKDIVFLPSRGQVISIGLRKFHICDCKSGKPVMNGWVSPIPSSCYRFNRWLSPVPDDRHLLIHSDGIFALWNMDTFALCWTNFDERPRARKSVVFPDGKRFVAVDTAGMVWIRDIEGGGILATLHILPKGFIWETPPDDSAPSGWLWTDREDLISVVARSTDGYSTKIFREGDERHKAYMKVHNNRRMVMARIEGEESYQRQVGLYASAVNTSRIGNGFGRSPAALPVGGTSDGDCPENQAGLFDDNDCMISGKEEDGL